MYFYLNGQPDGTQQQTVNQGTGANLTIGRRGSAPDAKGWFKGLIDDVRIYNRALSAEEVKVLAARDPVEKKQDNCQVQPVTDFGRDIDKTSRKSGYFPGDKKPLSIARSLDDTFGMHEEKRNYDPGYQP